MRGRITARGQRAWAGRLAAAGGGLALAGVLAWALAGTALAADQAVTISGFAFSPATLHVAVGDTVTWTNHDAANHTATASGAFDTGVIPSGESATVTLAKAGTFTYHCQIHRSMTGTIVVAAAAGTGTPRATAGPLPATDTPATPPRSDGYGWLILIAAVGAGFATLLEPARRNGRRRRG